VLQSQDVSVMISCRFICVALAVIAAAAPDRLRAAETKDDAIAFPVGDAAKLGVDVPVLEKLKAKAVKRKITIHTTTAASLANSRRWSAPS
jgi:hypothetical protein